MGIQFGLVQQGHIPLVEEMLDRNCGWQEINLAIGWAGNSAEKFYMRYLIKKSKDYEQALQKISELSFDQQENAANIAAGALDEY